MSADQAITTERPTTATLIDAQLLEWSKELLAIRSTHDRPQDLRKALSYVAAILESFPDITVEHFERNGVHSLLAYHGATRPERFKILLNGHLDVVPGSDEQFVPYVKDGKLYARGSLDMKIAVLIYARTFAKLAATLDYPVGLQIVTDEEPGGYNGTLYQYQQGVRADMFITGEQSGNDIGVAAKSICWIAVKFSGQPAHGAYLWRGDNALLKANDFINKILAVYPVPKNEADAWRTTVNVARIHTHTESYFNRVPDATEVHLDIRPLIEDAHFKTRDSVLAFIHSLAPEAEVEFNVYEHGHHTPSTNPLLQKLITSTEKIKGSPVQLLHRFGQSDIRHNVSETTAALEFGLKGMHDHAHNEHVELASLPILENSLRDFLLSVTPED